MRAGIDEAGRGPVIGPLVMAIVCLDQSQRETLQAAGVKDSKQILPAKRRVLAELIRRTSVFADTLIFTPTEIDAALNDAHMNLNRLEAKGTALLIMNALAHHNSFSITIDLPTSNANSYREAILDFLEEPFRSQFMRLPLVLEHKADHHHIEAAAASILAKTLRDTEIEQLKDRVGVDFGSGYPSDPKTVSFLKNGATAFPELCRQTWASYKRHQSAQRTLR